MRSTRWPRLDLPSPTSPVGWLSRPKSVCRPPTSLPTHRRPGRLSGRPVDWAHATVETRERRPRVERLVAGPHRRATSVAGSARRGPVACRVDCRAAGSGRMSGRRPPPRGRRQRETRAHPPHIRRHTGRRQSSVVFLGDGVSSSQLARFVHADVQADRDLRIDPRRDGNRSCRPRR